MITTIDQLKVTALARNRAILAEVAALWGYEWNVGDDHWPENKAFEVEEERPWWRILFTAFGLTVFLSVLGLIALVAILRPLCNHVRVSAQTLCDFIEGKSGDKPGAPKVANE